MFEGKVDCVMAKTTVTIVEHSVGLPGSVRRQPLTGCRGDVWFLHGDEVPCGENVYQMLSDARRGSTTPQHVFLKG